MECNFKEVQGDLAMKAEKIDHHRRHLFRAAAMTIAAAQLGIASSADAQSENKRETKYPATKPGTNNSFAPLKQIERALLNVPSPDAGPADGPPVILLHGWPYDIYSFVDVAPLLASAGYHVLVPYLR